MRRRLEPTLKRLWRGDAGPWGPAASALLAPLELAHRGVVALRNHAYDRGWLSTEEAAVPVVSVGNLLAGGTGKTPVAAWIARTLADSGRAPALVTRGYGDDESALHRRWNPDVPVFTDPDRATATAEAARAGRRSVVLDDGFQHRRLRRDLDLVLLPVECPRHVRLLPRGPYREPVSALRRADRVALVRRVAGGDDARAAERRLRSRFPELPVAHLRLAPGGWSTLAGGETDAPAGPLLAVTGIARPSLFRALVEAETGSDVELMEFPDHHAFTPRDLEEVWRRAGDRSVVTTEKDAVRLAGEADSAGPVRVLRLRLKPEAGAARLRAAVQAVAGPGSGEDDRSSGASAPSPDGRDRPSRDAEGHRPGHGIR